MKLTKFSNNFITSASRTGLQILIKNPRSKSVPQAPAKKLLPGPAGILPPVDHCKV